MDLAPNRFLDAIRKGEKQIGLWSSLCSPISAEVIGPSSFDWVCMDMEHSPNTIETIMAQLQVYAGYKTTALARVASNDPVLVKALLDIGTSGLIFPMIQNVEEAKRAVASTKYPPEGIRGVTGSSRATKFGRVKNYFQAANDSIAVILQLETLSALEQAEAIANIDGVDGVFFGPADIAADMNMIGKPMDERVWDEILPVAQRLIDRGIPVGTLVLDHAFAGDLLNRGFTFVACGQDTSILARGADDVLAGVKSKL